MAKKKEKEVVVGSVEQEQSTPKYDKVVIDGRLVDDPNQVNPGVKV